MSRVKLVTSVLIAVIALTACTAKQEPSANTNKVSTPTNTESTSAPATNTGALQPGQASGSYTDKGQTVELKYAYAGKDQRFGTESMVILVTDKPIPAESVADEIKNQTLLQSDQIRGLEYAIDNDGMWVRFHPGQYQESSRMQIKDYAVEGDIVRGTDENDGSLSNGKYLRSVKFVATVIK
jgi:hypothetical protein